MSEIMNGDWECNECGHVEHEPDKHMCPVCKIGQFEKIVTDADEVIRLTAENQRLREALTAVATAFFEDGSDWKVANRMVNIAEEALK